MIVTTPTTNVTTLRVTSSAAVAPPRRGARSRCPRPRPGPARPRGTSSRGSRAARGPSSGRPRSRAPRRRGRDLVHERRDQQEAEADDDREREEVDDRRGRAAPAEPPRRWSHSTAGFSASARNSETNIHMSTLRETQTIQSTTPTATSRTAAVDDRARAEGDDALVWESHRPGIAYGGPSQTPARPARPLRRLRRVRGKVDQAPEDPFAVGAQAVVVVLAGHPGAQAADRRRRSPRRTRARRRGPRRRSRPRPGPRWRRSTSASYSRGHSCAARISAASRGGASAP